MDEMMDTLSLDQSTADKRFYDQQEEVSDAELERGVFEIAGYFELYESRVRDRLRCTPGVVCELGAGTATLSGCLSRLEEVTRIYAADISSARMERWLGPATRFVGGDATKIEKLEVDFNMRLPFGNQTLDAIFFDAALHHSRSMWNLLAECNRVLRNGGLLVAQRESYLSPLRSRRQLAELKKSPEVAAQVSENMYLFEQYEYYLTVSGFEVDFIPARPVGWKFLMSRLNGVVFTDGVLFARKIQSRSA
jgi:SAM-dependent methyltransferase